jgi:hypothetical protein
MVDECAFGARFAAQFPPTEIFLNRVGNIGLTGLVVGRENGRERCATIVEAFLKEQVENGSFKLQEEEDGDAHATISTVTAGEEVTERVKRLRTMRPQWYRKLQRLLVDHPPLWQLGS